jgi:hypothetical protein
MHILRSIFVSLWALNSLVHAANFTNPLKDPNGSDPFIVYDGGYYYLTTTTWTDVQITRARTLEGLKAGERKTIWRDDNALRCCQVWAPGIYPLGDVGGQIANLLQRFTRLIIPGMFTTRQEEGTVIWEASGPSY